MSDAQRDLKDLLEGGESEPQEENKLEGVVEGEPVNDIQQALKDAFRWVSTVVQITVEDGMQDSREEGENHPVLVHFKSV